MAPVRRQTNGEAKDADLQVHPAASFQRVVQLQRAVGENSRVLAGRDGDGLRQHRSQRADRSHFVSG